MFCPNCGKEISDQSNFCMHCGNSVQQYLSKDTVVKEEQTAKKEFTGIYTTDIWGVKYEVYCPRCKSENCSHYSEEIVIPGKTKTRYTANLNPLKPFTLIDKKEKKVKKDKVKATPMIRCNDCGKTWKA